MRLHKATQDGKCPVCESNYRSGALLLLNDDVTPTVRAGCDQCSDDRVLAEMARLDAVSGPPKTEPPKTDKKKAPPKDEPWRKVKLVWREETYTGKRCETCGGGVEKGETVEEAVARELVEEAGVILAGRPRLISMHSNGGNFRGDHVLLYRVDEWEMATATSRGEILRVDWFHTHDLPQAATRGTRARLAEMLDGGPPDLFW